MTFVPKIPILKIASLVLLPLLAWFVSSKLLAPNELTAAIDESFSKAIYCYQTNDYQCAIESSRSILNMAPNHIEAKKLLQLSKDEDLKNKIRSYFTEIEGCLEAKPIANNQLVCAKLKLGKLSQIAKNSRSFERAKLLVSKTEKQWLFNQAIEQAEDCFNVKDYQCTENKAIQALDISPNNKEGLLLLENSKKATEKQKQLDINLEKRYNASMKKANACYKEGRFNCAIKQANIALSIKTEDLAAKDIKDDAKDSQKQYQLNLTRANRILKDGQACFKAFNYSCAIAKSESALEFAPKLKGAKQLKRDATNAIKNIKKSIEIN